MLQDTPSPPYFEFSVRPIEDPEASRREGHFVAKDVDFITLIPRGSNGKNTIEAPYEKWLARIKSVAAADDLRSGDSVVPMQSARFPAAWIKAIEEAYTYWKKGITPPEKGFPIAQWGVPSPAQREILTRLHILTVEQLAEANEDAMDNFGMGGRALRDKARDFLRLNKGENAKMVAEMAELRKKNESLEAQLKSLMSKLEAMNGDDKRNSAGALPANGNPGS